MENKINKNNLKGNEHNKLIDSNEYFFNYRNDNAFNQINNLETKFINKNYNKENFQFNSTYNNNISLQNKYQYKTNYIEEEKSNNNNLKESNISKYYDLKNSVNSIDSVKIREISMEENEIKKQINYEEKMLNELKEEKRRLIEEDKKRREMILLEINNNKNEIKDKKEEIKGILNECKIEKNKLKKNVINNNIENDANYFKTYLENIRERNELINKKSKEIINSKINNIE